MVNDRILDQMYSTLRLITTKILHSSYGHHTDKIRINKSMLKQNKLTGSPHLPKNSQWIVKSERRRLQLEFDILFHTQLIPSDQKIQIPTKMLPNILKEKTYSKKMFHLFKSIET